MQPQSTARASPNISRRHKRLVDLAIEEPTERIEQLLATELFVELLIRQSRQQEVRPFLRKCQLDLIAIIRDKQKKKRRALIRAVAPSVSAALLSGVFKVFSN